MVRKRVEDLIRTVCAPRWKVWVTDAKRAQARGLLLAAGAEAVPSLVDIGASDRRGCQGHTVRSVLEEQRDDEAVVSVLIDLANNAHNFGLLGYLLDLFEELSVRDKEAMPILLWSLGVGPSDTRRLVDGRYQIGEHDPLLRSVAQHIAPETRLMLSGLESFIHQALAKQAARVVQQMGAEAVPYLGILRTIPHLRDDARSALEAAIASVEKHAERE